MTALQLIDWLQRQAALVPPDLATAAVLMAAAALTSVVGLLRRRRAFLRSLPGALFIAAGAALFWPLALPGHSLRVRGAVGALALAALLIHVALHRRTPADSHAAAVGSARAARLYLAAALALAALFLLYNLNGYAGSMLVWEGPVVGANSETGGFARAFEQKQSILGFTARRFLWDNGVLSAGQTSLFYGAPTYALFHLLGFSPWTLRFPAALATLLSIVVIYILGRRFFGPVVGGAAAVLLGLNACVLFYGRYGSSPAGTLLAVLLAVLCTWLFLDSERSAWWMGGVCAAALYVATLQYSPVRIVVLILLGCIPLVLLCEWRRLWWRRSVGFLLIVAAAAGVWRLECAFNAQHDFLFARGEQFFHFLQHQDYIREFLGRPVLPEALTPFDTIELLVRVLQTTVPEYLGLLAPRINPAPPGAFMAFDPPPLPLYYAPVGLFIVWGFAHSLTRWRSWRHAMLLLWVVAATIPLLLTNRVDSHRMMLFVVPLTAWAALGVCEAAQVMMDAHLPRLVQHLVAAIVLATIVYNDGNLLYYSQKPYRSIMPYSFRIPYDPHLPANRSAQTLAAAIDDIPGPVAVGALLDHREVGWMQLRMLERARRDPQRSGTLLTEAVVNGVKDDVGVQPLDVQVRELEHVARSATVLLAPASQFDLVAAMLQRRGLRVAERGSPKLRWLRVDAGAAATGVPDDVVRPLPMLVIPPTPTPIALAQGPEIALSTLSPLRVAFGFAAPQVDHAWDGGPIVMAGVRYAHGLGTHAWCRMTYSVPPNAALFQAIVGLSDEVRTCSATAAVTFEVRDAQDRLLFDSGLVDATTGPRAVQVDVRHTPAITLVVTEGGNGRDCDHANWARPAFVLTPH